MKPPREIAESIFTVINDWHESSGENTQEMCIEKIEQAIQAERDEIIFLRDSLHIMEQVARDRTPRDLVEERDKLREENTRMRKALKFYADIKNHNHWNNNTTKVHADYGKMAHEVIFHIPETDKYAKIREAEMVVIKIARNLNRDTDCCHLDLLGALEVLDQLQKESDEK